MFYDQLLNYCTQVRLAIQTVQQRIIHSSSLFLKLLLAPCLLALYLVLALLSWLLIIFTSAQTSFTQLNQLDPVHGYTTSYTHHRSVKHSVQIGTVASTLVIMAVSIINGLIYTNQEVKAVGDCAISGTITLNQSYLDTNNCGNVTVTASATITVSAIDLGGSEDYTLTVNAGATAILNGTLALSDTGDSLVINGTVKHPSSGNTSLNITAQNVTINSGGSINVDGLGCSGGASGPGNDGSGPDASSGVCTVTTSGYGNGNASGASHGGLGGRGSTVTIGGTTYDSTTLPALKGSGGGSGALGGSAGAGGAGGGLITLNVASTLTVNGPISANGSAGSDTASAAGAGGGGAGGSIYLNVGTLAGSSTVKALAGNGGDNTAAGADGGGGGGGRIAIYYITNSSTFLASLSAANNVTKGIAGAGNVAEAADGADGTVYTLQYTVPSTPNISSPTAAATSQDRNVTMMSTAYSANGKTHTTSDWQISDDATFSNNDCSDSNIVFCTLADSSNLTSIIVNSTNGTFQNALSGKTTLAASTTYYVRLRHTNAAGNSNWSTALDFTTAANNAPNAPVNTAPSSTATTSKTPTLTTSTYTDLNNDPHTATDWLVYRSATCSDDVLVSDTGSTDLTSHTLSTILDAHTTYSFKVRYKDDQTNNYYSNYSTCTAFTTLNNSPQFSGTLDNLAFSAGTTTTPVFDLDDYFTDADDTSLTYSASGQANLSLTITAGQVVLSAPTDFSGTESIYFTAQDSAGATATSNTIVVTVTAAVVVEDTASEISLNDISYVRGKSKGKGIITVISKTATTLAKFQSFSKGGVIPRLASIDNKAYIFSVQQAKGNSLHIHTVNGTLVRKRKLSSQLQRHKLVTGNLRNSATTAEIVTATQRTNGIWLRVYSFDAITRKLTVQRQKLYRGITTNDYSVTIAKRTIHLVNKAGKTVLDWKPF